jgi:hypothetical protein
MTGQVSPLWTDEELDRGLARLRAEALAARGGAAETALPVARARLLAAAEQLAGAPAADGTDAGDGTGSAPPRVPRWRRGRWIAAAGAVAAGLVAAGVLVVAPFTGGSKPVAAAPVLSRAADAVTTRPDDPVEPGQYRYVQTTLQSVSRVTAAGHPNLAWRTTSRTRLWVPYDETDTWTREYRTVSGPRWLQGTAREARSNPLYGQSGEPAPTARARCGDFAAAAPAPTGRYCPGAGDWKQPTPHWLDTLPRDPHRLLAVLTADTGGEPGAERAGDALQRAWLLLGSGLAPADLRAALYRALALLPELRVTERVANLDGRRGTALGVDDGRLRRDLVIDPRTGRYLGQRLVLSAPDAGSDHGEPLPAGTVLDQTSVTVGVADHAGTVPPR